MKAQFLNIGLVFSGIVLIAGLASAQVSGVPNDGIPDVYYFQGENTINTSFGSVTRPAGTLLLDSDKNASGAFIFDVTAVLVSGNNVSTPTLGCDICDSDLTPFPEFRLPTGSPTSSPVAGGIQTVGFAGGATQWIRTSPLSGKGFRGVVGTGWVRVLSGNDVVVNAWPTNVTNDEEPDSGVSYGIQRQGLANYGAGLTAANFPATFNDGASEALWSVRVAADTLPAIYTNVTIIPAVPEPTTGVLGALCLAAVGFVRRQIG